MTTDEMDGTTPEERNALTIICKNCWVWIDFDRKDLSALQCYHCDGVNFDRGSMHSQRTFEEKRGKSDIKKAKTKANKR